MNKRIKELFSKYLSNACNQAELEEFLQIVRKSDHDDTLRHVLQECYEEVLKGSGTYVTKSGQLVIPGSSEPFVFPKEKPKRTRPVKMAMACLAAASFIFAFYYITIQYKSKAAPELSVLKKTSTERAEYKYILLPDSTQVWLNAGSTLEYPEYFNKDSREVTLSGEAYFDVKHAAEHPFIIHTGQIKTTVLGTAFNINAYSDRANIRISVSRGRVKVSRGDQLLATLVKDQEIKVSKTETLAPQKVLSASTVAAWQQGNMIYDDETLSEIIADLERVYNVNIQISNSRISSLQVTTRFRRELGISQALEILCKLTDSHLEEKNGTYFIQ